MAASSSSAAGSGQQPDPAVPGAQAKSIGGPPRRRPQDLQHRDERLNRRDQTIYNLPFDPNNATSVTCRFFGATVHGCRRGKSCKWLHQVPETGQIWESKFTTPSLLFASTTSVLRHVIASHYELPFEAWAKVDRNSHGVYLQRFTPRSNAGHAFFLPGEVMKHILRFHESHLRRPRRAAVQVVNSVFRNREINPELRIEFGLEGIGNYITHWAWEYVRTKRGSVPLKGGENPYEACAMHGACEKTSTGEFVLYHGTSQESAFSICVNGKLEASWRQHPRGIYGFPNPRSCEHYDRGAIFQIAVCGITLSKAHSDWLRSQAQERSFGDPVPIGYIAHYKMSQPHECVFHPESCRLLSVSFNYHMFRGMMLRHRKFRHWAQRGLPNMGGVLTTPHG